jgi:hypothetical protein
VKDYRLQGQNPAELSEMILKGRPAYVLQEPLWCEHCDDCNLFYCYLDMLVCITCMARYHTNLPARFMTQETSRVKCKCGDFRRSIQPKKMRCKRCGKVDRWLNPLAVQPLFTAHAVLEEKAEVLTQSQLKRVLKEGLDA